MTLPTAFRPLSALIAGAVLAVAQPAGAQLFWQPADLSTPPVTGAEPTSGINLPGATPAELRAGLLWHLRASLNVAALQCDFEPTLLTVSNYNAMLAHHDAELGNAFKVLGDYFKRTHGAGPGQKQFDQYGTRTYSSYSTVQAQTSFCQVAGKIGREAIFAPRGSLYIVAQNRLGELRNSLVAQVERVYGNPGYGFVASVPPLDKKCWKKGVLVAKCAATWEKTRGQ
ncbi:hypothetical protein LWE61_02930 [Sphingobium sufflavum]|uniref:hypothetical protein n=1 Tax=Sphingobium sufflavum TaxID=1129547 RepID=UPI001F1E93A9|nr:hypothetical protein [Sphingobium sufflavum]MCE7795507.1 hypothetical protein [Sphingobium sufflavum]